MGHKNLPGMTTWIYWFDSLENDGLVSRDGTPTYNVKGLSTCQLSSYLVLNDIIYRFKLVKIKYLLISKTYKYPVKTGRHPNLVHRLRSGHKRVICDGTLFTHKCSKLVKLVQTCHASMFLTL